jgi:DNA invertase Pin-like site-specific DNA recombinase
MRAAIYARVSTTNHGQVVTLQTRELEQFAAARGGRLRASTSILVSAARKIPGQDSTA